MAPQAATEFVVLTGFLGSGKTTLLLDFLAQPEAADTAVIVNEVGQINIDGAVIAETGRTLPVALLSNGCVCCSVSNDLLYTIEALIHDRRAAGEPPFRRIVLECSGLSRPGPVLRSLGELGPLAMPTHIVATQDCDGASLASGFDDAVAQLAAAQSIVLTKTDLRSKDERIEARARVRGINPLALLIDTDDRRERALAPFLLPGNGARPMVTEDPLHANDVLDHPRIEIMLVTFPDPPSWPDLEEWLENLAGFCGDRLLRVKGIVRVAGSSDPLLIQSVGALFSVPCRMSRAPDAEGLVIIARDTTVDALREARLGCRFTVSLSSGQTHRNEGRASIRDLAT